MKRRNFLVVLAYSAVLPYSNRILGEPCREKKDFSKLENEVSEKQARQAGEVLYKTLENYIIDYYKGDENHEGYIDFMMRYSGEIKKNVRLQGKAKVIEGYVELQRKCLNLAFSRVFQNVSNEEIDKLSDELVIHQKENARETYIDYGHSAVKEGYKSFAMRRVSFFKKIAEKNINKPQEDFILLFRNAFSREEYISELEEQKKARKDLYDSFAKSLQSLSGIIGFLVQLFGPGIIEKARKKSDEYNLREIERFYGKKE